MIADNTHVTRETRDIAIGLRTQMKEQRGDHWHLSKQVEGLTYRVAIQEKLMEDFRRKAEKDTVLWGIFSRREALFLAGIALASLGGLLKGPQAQQAVLSLFGLG